MKKEIENSFFSTYFYASFIINFMLLFAYIMIRIFAIGPILHRQGKYGLSFLFSLFIPWEHHIYYWDSPIGMISGDILYFLGSAFLVYLAFPTFKKLTSSVKNIFWKWIKSFSYSSIGFLALIMLLLFAILYFTPGFLIPLEKPDTFFGNVDENNYAQMMLFRWSYFDKFGEGGYGFDFSNVGGLYKYYLLFAPVFYLLSIFGKIQFVPILNFVIAMFIYLSILNIVMIFLLLTRRPKANLNFFLSSFLTILTVIIVVFKIFRLPGIFGFDVIQAIYFYNFLGAWIATYLFTLLIFSLIYVSGQTSFSLEEKLVYMLILLSVNFMLITHYYHFNPLYYFIAALSLPIMFSGYDSRREFKLNTAFIMIFLFINHWGMQLNSTGGRYEPMKIICLIGFVLLFLYAMCLLIQKFYSSLINFIRKHLSWYIIGISFIAILYYCIHFYGTKYIINWLSLSVIGGIGRTYLLEFLFLSLFLALMIYFVCHFIYLRFRYIWLVLIMILIGFEYYLYNFHQITTSTKTELDHWFEEVCYDVNNLYFYDEEYKVRIMWNEYYVRAIRFIQRNNIKKRLVLLGDKFASGKHESCIATFLISDRDRYLEAKCVMDNKGKWLEEKFPGGKVTDSTKKYFTHWLLLVDNKYFEILMDHVKQKEFLNILYSNRLYKVIEISEGSPK